MNLYEAYIRARSEQADDTAADALSVVANQIDNGDPMKGVDLSHLAYTESIARWWRGVVAAIEDECLDAVDALARTRDRAHAALVEGPIPHPIHPIDLEVDRVRTQAARAFYNETRHIDDLRAAVDGVESHTVRNYYTPAHAVAAPDADGAA